MFTNNLSLNNLSAPSTSSSTQLNNLSPGLPPNILTPPTTPYSYNMSVLECYQNPPNTYSRDNLPSCQYPYPSPFAKSEPTPQWSADSLYAPVPIYFTFPPVAPPFPPSCALDPRSKNIRSEDFLPPPTVTIHHHPTLPLSAKPSPIYTGSAQPYLSSSPYVPSHLPPLQTEPASPTLPTRLSLASPKPYERNPKVHSEPSFNITQCSVNPSYITHPYTSSPTPSKVSRTRRHSSTPHRTYFPPHSINYLEEHFAISPTISSAKKETLSNLLKIPARNIALWFKNKRAKQRRQEADKERIRRAAETGKC